MAKSSTKWRKPSPKIMWEYGNGARFRTLRSTIVENPLQTCCDGRLSRRVADTAGSTASRLYFMQNKANFKTEVRKQMMKYVGLPACGGVRAGFCFSVFCYFISAWYCCSDLTSPCFFLKASIPFAAAAAAEAVVI